MSVLGEGPRVAGAVAISAPMMGLFGSGQTNIQQTQGLLWLMIGVSVAGVIVTFAFLIYSVVKFRDPNNRRRRYG